MSIPIGPNGSSYNPSRQYENPIDNAHNNQNSNRKRKASFTTNNGQETAIEDEASIEKAVDDLVSLKRPISNGFSEKQRRIDETSEEGGVLISSVEHSPIFRAIESLRFAKSYLEEKRYQEAIEESDKGLKAECEMDEINLKLTDCKNKAKDNLIDNLELQQFINKLSRLLEDKKDSRRYAKARELYGNNLDKLKQALKLATKDADKMRILENISKYADNFGTQLSNLIEILDSELAFNLAIEKSKEAFKLATKDADKMRVLEDTSKYLGNYGYMLSVYGKNSESQEKYGQSKDKLEEALNLAENAADKMRILKHLSSDYEKIGYALYLLRRYPSSEEAYKNAIINLKKNLEFPVKDADKMSILEGASRLYKLKGDSVYFRRKYARTEKACEEVIEPYNLAIINAKEALKLATNNADKMRVLKDISGLNQKIGRVQFEKGKFEKSTLSYKKYIKKLKEFSKLKIKQAKEEENKDIDQTQSNEIFNKYLEIANKFFEAKQYEIAKKWAISAKEKYITKIAPLENMESGQKQLLDNIIVSKE